MGGSSASSSFSSPFLFSFFFVKRVENYLFYCFIFLQLEHDGTVDMAVEELTKPKKRPVALVSFICSVYLDEFSTPVLKEAIDAAIPLNIPPSHFDGAYWVNCDAPYHVVVIATCASKNVGDFLDVGREMASCHLAFPTIRLCERKSRRVLQSDDTVYTPEDESTAQKGKQQQSVVCLYILCVVKRPTFFEGKNSRPRAP